MTFCCVDYSFHLVSKEKFSPGFASYLSGSSQQILIKGSLRSSDWDVVCLKVLVLAPNYYFTQYVTWLFEIVKIHLPEIIQMIPKCTFHSVKVIGQTTC